MTRAGTNAVISVVAALGAGLACSDTTTNTIPQLNLDRPVDIAFACYGGLRLTGGGAATPDQDVVSSAQPLESCNLRAQLPAGDGPSPVPPGQEDLSGQGGTPVPTPSYYAFILQSGPGTVALARFDAQPSTSFTSGTGDVLMLDADPLTPGKNSITVGEDPVAIVTDRAGCYEVVANAGSCDLSVLDINSVFQNETPGEDPIVKRLAVSNAAGDPIDARPAAMVVEPSSGTIGEVCPAEPSGLVYIAYPNCHMVAGVDVSTGTIVTAIQFDETGTPTITDGNVTCPSECMGAGGISTGVRPVALDLEVDARSSRRLLAIGADNSNLLTLIDLDATYRPLTVSQVALEDTAGRLGLVSLAISPLIGMGGATGMINDGLGTAGDHQFVYAVATDGSVRVADIQGAPRECDTQVDPRLIREVRDVDALACFEVGAMTTPARRPGAEGPGITLPNEAVPLSVEVFRVDSIPNDTRQPGSPGRLVGYFGMVTASNGQTFVLNVDDDDYPDFVDPQDPLGTQIPLTIAHQLRDGIPARGLLAEAEGRFVCNDPGPDPDASGGANLGGPRMVGNIARNVPPGTLAAEKFGGLPSIRQVYCDAEASDQDDRPVSELSFSAPVDVREMVFPDLRALRSDETWSLTWEGSLSLDSASTSVDGPAVREGQMFADGTGMRIVDASRPFCEAGVEPYDIVQLRGCDPALGDAGCPIGYTCYVHPQSQVGLGSCMLVDEAERLANACRQFLTSLRRYTVSRASNGELTLLPRKHVLRTTPITGCTDDAQCQELATYALSNRSSANPVSDQTPDDTRTWACQVDPDRRPELDPLAQPLKRCILTCDEDNDCAAGMICSAHAGAAPRTGYCMEGVVPPQSCINAPQRYEVRAGDAFAMIGSRTGFVHPIVADDTGRCVRDPDAHPYLQGRIPLRAPACDPDADPRTGQLPDGTYEPNPCQTTVDETEYQLNYVAGTCTLDNPDESLVTRPATALRLRNPAMTLTLVDPTYQGDLMCHGDRAGTLVDVPLVAPGFQLAFRQTAGFAPMTLGIAPTFPIKVVRGPGESIWVIDEGDFISTSITQASTRGRVYRVESVLPNIINLLE